MTTPEIQIPIPEFDQYQTVQMDWNGTRQVKIVARWYEFDKSHWWYKISNDETFYPETAFLHIIDGQLWGTKEEYLNFKSNAES